MVLKEVIFNSFYFGRVWWSLKNSLFTVFTLGGCGVLKELIFNCVYFGRVWWSSVNLFLTVDTLDSCGGPERTDL